MNIRSHVRKIRNIARETSSFARGYRELLRTNATPIESYHSLRQLYCMTNGRFNDAASWVLSLRHRPRRIPPAQSVLGDISDPEVKRIAREVEMDGFYIFERKLPAEIVEELREFGQTIPCRAMMTAESGDAAFNYAKELAPYRSHPVESPKYDILQRDILANATVQQLLMDPGLLRVAQEFLRCAPVLDLAAMWWSRPFRGKASTEAAQLYHFDMDRIKLFKFFFYLSDVTPESGPHCYVRGSSTKAEFVLPIFG